MRDAYDVLDELNRAGVHLIVTGDRLAWRCDPRRPPVPGWLFLELQEHKADVRRVLLDVPVGCPVPHICHQLGICPREIASSACTYGVPQRREAAA
ncbi:MAG TPA: hypothetical protein VGW38_29110 [Chloroflexota bacterium]|nr:hypothetical protein [Chloroflexota bacterium]